MMERLELLRRAKPIRQEDVLGDCPYSAEELNETTASKIRELEMSIAEAEGGEE